MRREEKPAMPSGRGMLLDCDSTSMSIIRSSRLYVCYYSLWYAMPWLLVVGRQVQGSQLCVRDEGCCSTATAVYALASSFPCLSARRCLCVEKKNQLDATELFIALIIC